MEPDVSCISATSSSSVLTGIDRPSSRSWTVTTHTRSASRGGGRKANRSDDDRSGDHVDDGGGLLGPALQVGARGGLVQHGQTRPRIQMPWAVRAISTGAPASTATASPWPTPEAARPPAT